jgi:putative membrane protein
MTQQLEPMTAAEPRRRLHPLTPLLRGIKLAAVVILALSWQGLGDLGLLHFLEVVGGLMVLALVASAVSWYVTGYHVVGRELRVYEGLLWRRTRAIPLERLQAVEIVQPLLARVFGLAELRLEVVGAAKTEAPLAFLPLGGAQALRTRLLELAGLSRPAAAASDLQPATVGADERIVHVVSNGRLAAAQLLRPHWWFIPLAAATPVFFFFQSNELGFVAIASTLTAVAGALWAPVRAVIGDWSFTIATAHDGLRLRRGLTERRSQTVPRGRIQAITVRWPLLWRLIVGWSQVSMRVAGINQRERQELHGGALLPVGDVATTELVLAEAMPGLHLSAVGVHPVPRRAAWLAPLRLRVLGCLLTPEHFVSRDGLIARELSVVPYPRIQSVRLRQGPVQRLLRLATVHVDVAGGTGAIAPHRDVAEAVAIASELADRSRRARHDGADRQLLS